MLPASRSPFPRPLAALLALLVAAAAGCAAPDPAQVPVDVAAARTDWQAWVARRDSLFATDASPLLPAARAAFSGLPYFPYDTALVVRAAFVPAVRADTGRFPTSTGELRPMVTAGQLVFQAGGAERRLVAYHPLEEAGPGRLFVPFRDATSGRETYGGGRYLDLDVDPAGRYTLDLNQAYHPYCVYAEAFSCPLPPPENTMELRVTAGERLPDSAP